MMAFSEAYAVINLALIVGVMVFSVENDCGTVWELNFRCELRLGILTQLDCEFS